MDTVDNPITWPPTILVKRHPRAKHVKLRTTKKHGLELVVPKRFNLKDIPFILEQNRQWIEKQLRKIQSESKQSNPTLPDSLVFLGIQQQWPIQYQQSSRPLKIISRPHQELVLLGNVKDKQACKDILMKWVKKIARDALLNQLEQISTEIQLPYAQGSVRNQSTRWGSCSSQKTISLNFKLIFLPPELTRHIIIHELCHTRHLNHSDKFWDLVGKFDHNWLTHRQMMRKADQYIPSWVDAEFSTS